MRRPRHHLLAALVVLSLAGPLHAEPRHGAALVVVNRDQETNSAAAAAPGGPLAAALAARGFSTTVRDDVGRGELRATVKQFVVTAPTNGVALLYLVGFAAHVESDTGSGYVDARGLLEQIRHESGAEFHVVVLDDPAARDDRSATGVARLPPPTSSCPDNLLLCRAGPGFAPALIEALEDTGTDMSQAIRLAATTAGSWTFERPTVLLPPLREAAHAQDAVAPGRRAGDEWVNALGTVFCWCPAGELPRRGGDALSPAVMLERGFWLGKYEVTKREFDLVTPKKPRGALATRPSDPRDGIRHDDVLQFVDELNRRERFFERLPDGWEYALPTEWEWEYAYRAGSSSVFAFGDDASLLPDHANFADRSLYEEGDEYTAYAERRWNDGIARLGPPGTFRPNSWGLHDMAGNLWEWTASIEESRGRRCAVARGGSWASLPDSCRASFRHRFETSTERGFIGFRLALRPTLRDGQR